MLKKTMAVLGGLLAAEAGFKAAFFLRPPGGDATTLMVLEAVCLGAGIAVLMAMTLRQAVTRRRFNDSLAGFILSAGRLLDHVFAHLDDSFILVHSIFTAWREAGGEVSEAERDLTDLFREKEVDDSLERKVRPVTRDLSAAGPGAAVHLDELASHAGNIIRMLAAVKASLSLDARSRLDLHKRNLRCAALLNDIIVSSDFYSKIIHEFLASIIVNLTSSTRPLAQEILTIRELATAFVDRMAVWDKDLTDENSPHSVSALVDHYHRQDDSFSGVSASIKACYEALDERLSSVSRAVATMTEKTAAIQDVAEKITVLSINASIESARAGAEGRGFKVIADQIQNLSGTTHGMVDEIRRSMAAAHEEVERTVVEFGEEGKLLNRRITEQKDSFSVFYANLDKYAGNFKGVFSAVTSLIVDIDFHIKGLNPLFQLHEVSVQEMENFNAVVSHFLGGQRDELAGAVGHYEEAERRERLKRLIREYEQRIISKFELNVLEKVVAEYDLTGEMKLAGSGRDVEIF